VNILLISTGIIETPPLAYGGLEQVVADLAIELDLLGHKVAVVCTNDSKIGEIGGIDAWVCGPRDTNGMQWDLNSYNSYKDRLKEFDVIHDHSWGKPAYLAKRENPKLNVISTIHGMCPYRSLPTGVAKPCFVGISMTHAQEISSILHCKVEYAYNGVDLGRYSYAENGRGDRLLFVGRITPYKGVHIFLDICQQTGMKGDIIGDDVLVEDGDYVLSIIDRVNKMGGQVTYWGNQSREFCIEMYQKALATVSPVLAPWSEPFGLVAVESMACGTPVLATENGGLAETIVDGVTGFTRKHPWDLGKDISSLSKLRAVDCKSRAEQFSRRKMAERYLELYQRIIDGGAW
jgi:glycosyltransferase involved in cell wall biosynthesis